MCFPSFDIVFLKTILMHVVVVYSFCSAVFNCVNTLQFIYFTVDGFGEGFLFSLLQIE